MKKTRTILCADEAMEQKVYHYCDKLHIRNKNITTCLCGDLICIDIFCGKKKWNTLRFMMCLEKTFF